MADPTTWTLVQETYEFVGPIIVLADGVPTTAFQVCVTNPGVRPDNWQAPTILDTGAGVLVGVGSPFPLLLGNKATVWIQFTDAPEIPVQRVGYIRVI